MLSFLNLSLYFHPLWFIINFYKLHRMKVIYTSISSFTAKLVNQQFLIFIYFLYILFTFYIYIYIVFDIHVPKCMSCHKAIVVITGRAHCFHDCIYKYMIYISYVICVICVISKRRFSLGQTLMIIKHKVK